MSALPEHFALAGVTATWVATAGYAYRHHRLSLTDSLTGLANRAALANRIGRAARHRAGTVGLIMLDLDRFKSINDTHGHEAGNTVLRALAARLDMISRSGELPVRLHGDEFALWLGTVPAGSAGRQHAQQRADAIHDVMSAPFPVRGHRLRLTVSTGVAALPTAGLTLPALLALADHALYQAKRDTYRATGAILPATTTASRLRDIRKDVA